MTSTDTREDGDAKGSDLEGNVLTAARGSGFLAAGGVFEFATRFLVALLLARMLGAHDYGLYVIAISTATIFSGFSGLGLDDAMVRYVAVLAGRRDRLGVWGTIQIGIGVSAVAGLLLGCVLFAAAAPLAERVFDDPRLIPLFRLLAIVVPFLTISNVLAGTARGFGRMDYAAFAENVVMSVVRLGLLVIVAAVTRSMNVVAATIVFGISDVAATITLVVLLHRNVPAFSGHVEGAPRRDVREIFGFALPLWLAGMLRQFRKNFETLVLGATRATSSVGIYAIVSKVNLVGHIFLLSIFMAVKPTLATLHDRRDRAGLGHLYITATRWALSLTLPFFLVSVLYPKAILVVFGSSFTAGATALVILSFAELANAATGICGPMIDMTGHTRVKLLNSVVLTVVLLVTNALLIPRWGVNGAAIASLIGITTFNVLCVAEVWMLERLWPFDSSFAKPLIAGTAALLAGVAVEAAAPVGTNTGMAIAQAVLVTAVYLSLLLLLKLPGEERLVIERTVRKATTLLAAAGRRPNRTSTGIRTTRIRARGARRDAEAVPPDRGPIYIGGLDRSGKTTMAAFLTSHPNIAVPGVGSNMWTYFYRRYGDLAKPENVDRCVESMLRYSHVAYLEPDAARIRREFDEGPPTYARLFALFLDHFAEREGKPRWGVQTGLIERYADQIFAADPGAKVVHMVRDPRDRYAASLALWPTGRGRAGGAAARWGYSMRLAERHVRRYPDRYMIVRYEDMVLRTEQTLRAVCAFVGEEFFAEMLSMPGAPERRERLVARIRQPGATGMLSAEFIGRFHEHVPVEEIVFLQRQTGRRMRAYGYSPASTRLSARERARFSTLVWPSQFGRMVVWRAGEELQQRLPGIAGRRPDEKLTVRAAGSLS